MLILVLLNYKMWLWSLRNRKSYLFELQPWVSAHSLAQVVAGRETVRAFIPRRFKLQMLLRGSLHVPVRVLRVQPRNEWESHWAIYKAQSVNVSWVNVAAADCRDNWLSRQMENYSRNESFNDF